MKDEGQKIQYAYMNIRKYNIQHHIFMNKKLACERIIR